MADISKTNEIVVIGELNVDLIASGLLEKPALGREILAADFTTTLGSASAIFASGAARLGRGVTFVSRVGDDEFGRFCVDTLAAKNISAEHVKIDRRSKTGVTMVLSTSEDRALVTYLGAIGELSFDDVPFEIMGGHRHLHLTSYYLQAALQPDFSRLMRAAREKGLTTSFDPNSDPDQKRNENVLEVAGQTDILFLNEPEAKLLAGTDDVLDAGRELNRRARTVVIKLGAKGSVGFENGKIVSADGFRVEAIDTTGAGDSFAAGFVHAFLDGRELKECLTIGNACGALSTSKPGGTDGQPGPAELDQFLAKAAAAK